MLLGVHFVASQDTAYVRSLIRKLTSEKMYGRGYSFRGDSIAASFIKDELIRLKVTPMADFYSQYYTFSTSSMEGPLQVEINGQRLKPYDEYRVPAWSLSSWGKYDVVNVPLTTLTDADAMKKFLKKHSKALADLFVYIDATEQKGFNESERKRIDSQIRNLQRRNPFNSRGIILALENLNTYSPANTDFKHDYAYVEVLKSAVKGKIKDFNCSIFSQFHPAYRTQNIYGCVHGETDTMIVYSAHYDHLGTMGDSVIYYGAHDNASGVATLLDIARMTVAEKPHYTHVFCFFSGEEAGLKGSRYASEHPVFDFDKVKLLINIDMFCGGDEGLMVFNANADNTTQFVQRLENLNTVLALTPQIKRRENRPNSDHWWLSKKMPAIFILTMGQRYGGYHDPYDTCDRCGLENYKNFVTLISSLAL